MVGLIGVAGRTDDEGFFSTLDASNHQHHQAFGRVEYRPSSAGVAIRGQRNRNVFVLVIAVHGEAGGCADLRAYLDGETARVGGEW